MEIKGTLKALQPVVEKSNFKSRKAWINTDIESKYPQVIEVELQQDKVTMMDGVSIGAPVTLHCNLRGREWTGTDGVTKVFNSLVCWKVEGVAYSAPVSAAPVAAKAAPFAATPEPDAINDLPF